MYSAPHSLTVMFFFHSMDARRIFSDPTLNSRKADQLVAGLEENSMDIALTRVCYII